MECKKLIKDPQYAKILAIPKLVKCLVFFSQKYYVGDPLISDEVYDTMYDILKERDPKNAFFYKVGYDIEKNKVKLPYFMPSLDKIKEEKMIERWLSKYPGPYSISEKLDGISCLYDSSTQKLYTRGNGIEGMDVSYIKNYISKIPKNAKYVIRGELIMKKSVFKRKYSKDFKNARNLVAGMINTKKVDKRILKDIDFVVYTIVFPRFKHHKQLELLTSMKFHVVWHTCKRSFTKKDLMEWLRCRKDHSEYEVDGLVIIDNSRIYPKPTELKNPKHAFAFKMLMKENIVQVTVLDVEYTLSKHGYYKPRIRIKPVTINQVTIEYLTGFNGKYILDHQIGPGTILLITRSGDVIPHILKVIKSTKAKVPKNAVLNESGVDFMIKKIHKHEKKEIFIKKLHASLKLLKVKHINEKTIEKLLECSTIHSILDFLEINKEKCYTIEGLGKVIVDKIFQNIEKSIKNASIPELFVAGGFFPRGLGVKKIKLILHNLTIQDLMEKDKKEIYKKILKIEGFAEKTTNTFLEILPKLRNWIQKLKEYHLLKESRKENISKKFIKLFRNQKVVFTGFRSKELEELIEKAGGTVLTTISKNTTLVIYKSTTSSKYKKAKELGIRLISYEKIKILSKHNE